MFDCADIFFRLESGGHDLMPAAHAPQPEVCPGAQHQPALFSTGMGLFHDQNVVDFDVHITSLSVESAEWRVQSAEWRVKRRR